MSDTRSVRSGGIGLGGAVFVLFLGLKLAGVGPVAAWSWWWVTSPLWIPGAVTIAVVAVIGLVAGVVALYEARQ